MTSKGGRPKREFDQNTFEGLCQIQCTEKEMCQVLRTTDKTLDMWCRRTYGEGFSDTYKKLSSVGKASLRRTQFNLAKKSAAMAIFLGKQYLGQRDQQDIEISTTKDDSIRAMEKYFENAREDYKGTP